MQTITLEECKKFLKEKFPEFIPYWEAELSLWDDEGMFAIFSPFAAYTRELITANNPIQLKRIFENIEFLLTEGDESVQSGVATVFLEDLMNKDPDEIKFSSICQYLGKESIAYCRAWDEFCGVRTEGLWTDEEKRALIIESQINLIEGYRIAECFLRKYYVKKSSRDIKTLLSKLPFINSTETADPNAWKLWNECVKNIKSKGKRGGFDIVEAYQTLQCFLEQYNQATRSKDIDSLLMGMVLSDYKSTRDPAAWSDWIACVNSCINWEKPVK